MDTQARPESSVSALVTALGDKAIGLAGSDDVFADEVNVP